MPVPNAADRLTGWILEKASEEPLQKRVSLYRDAAATIASSRVSARLSRLADELEAIEARHQQLLLDLRGGR
jgi:hypothetical protein